MLLDILDVVTTVALLYIIASGLFVVFGVMSVINLSHGAFIVLGAYTSIVVTGVAINPWWNFVLAPAVGFVFGAAIEFIVIRRLYARSLDTILATWGLSIIVVQVITIIFGREAHFSDAPIHGFVELGDLRYSAYRLVIVGIAVGVPLGIYGRWSGWGFGLGWWGRPTPVRVLKETPLTGAQMKGGAEWAVTEAAHRVLLELEVLAPEVEPYDAEAITWFKETVGRIF